MNAIAHRLRHRVAVEARSDVQDPVTGAVDHTWSSVGRTDIPAEVMPMSGRELLASAGIQTGLTTRITMRARDDLAPNMRVLFGGLTFDIKFIIPDPSFSRHVQLLCESGVVRGD